MLCVHGLLVVVLRFAHVVVLLWLCRFVLVRGLCYLVGCVCYCGCDIMICCVLCVLCCSVCFVLLSLVCCFVLCVFKCLGVWCLNCVRVCLCACCACVCVWNICVVL